jgi:long-chain fatty acid transport protein
VADDLVEPLGWDDTLRAAVGLVGAMNQRWTVRFGAAFDESPVPGPELRSARVPDSDRWWLAAGASYHPSPEWSIDFGYARLFAEDPDIRRSGPAGSTFIGDYDSAADIVSVQLTMSL